MTAMKNILFYLYVRIEPKDLRDLLLTKAKSLNILGKILLAKEGINGCVSGDAFAIEEYKTFLHAIPEFQAIEFKEADTNTHTFKKMFVRIRKEIVPIKTSVDVQNKAAYIEPSELKRVLEKEDVVLLDARNNYESKIGRFKNAILPDITLFSEFPKAVEELHLEKDTPIITYCTGGIRCEKASAYLIEKGYTNVRQLHGGIIRYGQEVGDDHWEGQCFVFDRRGAISIDPNKQATDITQCEQCAIPSSNYHNCERVVCDRRVILCEKCIDVLEGCCDKACRGKTRVDKAKEKNENAA